MQSLKKKKGGGVGVVGWGWGDGYTHVAWNYFTCHLLGRSSINSETHSAKQLCDKATLTSTAQTMSACCRFV